MECYVSFGIFYRYYESVVSLERMEWSLGVGVRVYINVILYEEIESILFVFCLFFYVFYWVDLIEC